MAIQEALVAISSAAAVGSPSAGAPPANSETHILHRPAILEQTYQAPSMSFEQYAASQLLAKESGPVGKAADIDPGTGQQYDPEALAGQCVQDATSREYAHFGNTFDNPVLLAGQTTVNGTVSAWPMTSRLSGVPCPDAGVILKQRLSIQGNRIGKHGQLQYEPGPWDTVLNDTPNGIEAVDNTELLSLDIPAKLASCVPARVRNLVVQRFRKAHPHAKELPDVTRHVRLESYISAHSLDRTAHTTIPNNSAIEIANPC